MQADVALGCMPQIVVVIELASYATGNVSKYDLRGLHLETASAITGGLVGDLS